jgi:lysozyme
MRCISVIGTVCVLSLTSALSNASEFVRPWKDPSTVLILDPYGPNHLELEKVATDKRVVGIIHQASRGLESIDSQYKDRRSSAKAQGYLSGSYHLLTNADTKAQIDRYLEKVGIHADETYAIDVECLPEDSTCKRPNNKVTPAQILAALKYFKEKVGWLPLLYVNGHIRDAMSPRIAADPGLKATRLWYARNISDISRFFPDRQWKSYTIWQFSSELNCNPSPGACPYRVPGTNSDMDLNVFYGSEQKLRASWPLDR